jgi:DNA modification methylase
VISTTEGKQYKLTKDLLDQMRSVEGFPTGKDEDIIALSDPPFYTACPNPWIEKFIKENGKPWDPKTDSYNREPFAADVSEGKNDPIYNAHSYHTKVPHKAIMRYILHYTEPGDIVFDGFCGTGMTGVAAQMCANPEPEFKEKIEREMPRVKWGARKAILNDLSPAATFIADNYNTPVDVHEFETETMRILSEFEHECGWIYQTQHVLEGKPVFNQDVNGTKQPVFGRINFTVWSDVFDCPSCAKEIIFWDVAVDIIQGKIREEFPCPHCHTNLTKRTLERAWESFFDDALQTTIKRAKQIPVLINYSVQDSKGKWKRFEKKPNEQYFELHKKIENTKIPYWYPNDRMPEGYNTEQPKISHGLTHVHHYYEKTNLYALSVLNSKIETIKSKRVRELTRLVLTAIIPYASKLRRFRPDKKGGGPLSGTLYVASIITPPNTILTFERNAGYILEAARHFKNLEGYSIISTQSSTDYSNHPSNSIDYIFVDPPFGGNLMYSELNFLWEAWLKVFTNNKQEAIINSIQRKGLSEYQHIMEQCFIEFYRILKPGRWMTVEFHNSQNSVWMSIQEGLQRAGFVVADVRTLDKKQGTFKQVTTTAAVKQDLIISAYKPNGGLEDRFKLTAGTIEGVWDFVRQHLKHLPVFVEKEGTTEVVAERLPYLLFDRMVAFHVQRGVIVPISAGDFYGGLRQRFPERDGMYFLETDVLEYDKKRMNTKRIEQASLFIHDEKSAVQWLHKELSEKSQTSQDIQPKFLLELHQDKFEKMPELTAMLEQNFLQDLKGQWYVPDPNKLADLDKVRERSLLKEFEEYKKTKGKLKLFRTEAVRAGFKKAWSERDYGMIIIVGERLPSQILQEDDVLLMYYDNAITRSGIT